MIDNGGVEDIYDGEAVAFVYDEVFTDEEGYKSGGHILFMLLMGVCHFMFLI